MVEERNLALCIGSSRGIGRQIAIDLAKDGCNVVVSAKNNWRSHSIKRLVQQTLLTYGRLDILIYNSGAIWWASVENTPMKRFQLLQRLNPEGL